MRVVTIALDAMGGDRAPSEICVGALDAVVPGQIEIVLVGDTPLILAEYGGKLPRGVTVRHAPEQIAFDEEPLAAVRTKPESSLVVTAGAVRDGWAQAAVSAGSTGALMAASTFSMRRITGVQRPGLAAVIPALGGPLTLIDCGANIDPRPEMLVQFAHMGACFAEDVLGRRAPRVGLLSIGEEPGKGNQLTKEVFELLAAEAGLDFAGNIEGRDLLVNKVQVVVTDAFTGNVALKTAEGTAIEVFKLMQGHGQAQPADQGRRAAAAPRRARPAHAARPRDLRRSVPARPRGHRRRGARIVVAGRDRQRLPDGRGGRAARRLRPRRGPRRARGGPGRHRLRRLSGVQHHGSATAGRRDGPPGPLSATFGRLYLRQ